MYSIARSTVGITVEAYSPLGHTGAVSQLDNVDVDLTTQSTKTTPQATNCVDSSIALPTGRSRFFWEGACDVWVVSSLLFLI